MRIHSDASGNAKQAFGFLVMGTQKRQAYEVTFTQPKLGLNVDDKDGGVCVMRASGENGDVIGGGDEITSFNGKSCLAAQGDPTSKTPAPVTLAECSSSGAPAEEFALEPAPNASASAAQFRLEVGDGRCIAAQPTQPAA